MQVEEPEEINQYVNIFSLIIITHNIILGSLLIYYAHQTIGID